MSAPVVFTQIVTDFYSQPMLTRTQSVTSNGFQVMLQAEEAQSVPGSELVSWLVVNKGAIGRGGAAVNYEVDEQGAQLSWFGGHEEPFFFASMQTTNGPNTAGLRYRGLSTESAMVYVEEETSSDTEVDHIYEEVGYMVLWNAPPEP
jgi:hypothetical protein